MKYTINGDISLADAKTVAEYYSNSPDEDIEIVVGDVDERKQFIEITTITLVLNIARFLIDLYKFISNFLTKKNSTADELKDRIDSRIEDDNIISYNVELNGFNDIRNGSDKNKYAKIIIEIPSNKPKQYIKILINCFGDTFVFYNLDSK